MTSATAVRQRKGFLETLRDIYHERTNYNFIGRSWLWMLISGTAVLVSAAALLLSGLNLGIDFNGGTQWQLNVKSGSANAEDVRNILKKIGVPDPKVLILGDDGVRVQAAELKTAQKDEVRVALAKYAGADAKDQKAVESTVSVTDVGPTWGDRISRKALLALGVFFILIAVYLTFRFEIRMALAALAAVVHDIVITVGVYAITGFEVTPATVVAFLTILGFSLYDTVVVFDKVKENTPHVGVERADTYSGMVNRSLNQVLMRSLNTSFVALLPVASLLFVGTTLFGAVTLRDFALALFVGLLVGAYSSIFVATPILAWLKEREPRYKAIRERSTALRARDASTPGITAPATAAVGAAPGAAPEPPASIEPPVAAPRPPGIVAPRPRQQRGKRRRR
jgi:preprotein translocase subunit SecF